MSWLRTSSSADFNGQVPEVFRNSPGTKTEQLKNRFSREIQEELLHMDSVFQFCSFDSGTMPEYFRKKMKTNFFRDIPGRFSIWIQFLSFGSGTIPEYLRKNWKTVFSREVQEEILHMDSVFQFFSFGSGTILEKTENCFFSGTFRRRWPYGYYMDSVFQFHCIIGQEQLHNCFLRVSWVSSLHVIYFVYILEIYIYMYIYVYIYTHMFILDGQMICIYIHIYIWYTCQITYILNTYIYIYIYTWNICRHGIHLKKVISRLIYNIRTYMK